MVRFQQLHNVLSICASLVSSDAQSASLWNSAFPFL
jgi:hypothetical protein